MPENLDNCNVSQKIISNFLGFAALSVLVRAHSAFEAKGDPVATDRIETFRGLYLRRELSRLRERAELSLDDVAERTDLSKPKLSRIENGKIGVSPSDLRLLLDAYGVTDQRERETMLTFARDVRKRGWWYQYSDVIVGSYVALEAEAAEQQTYQTQLIPGLFQTEQYFRALHHAAKPNAPDSDAERWWTVRQARQGRYVGDDAPQVWAVLDESVIRRPVGGSATLRGQLLRLGEIARQPNITLQVLPLSAGAHAAQGISYTVLSFPPTDLAVVYLEHLGGDLYLDADDAVARYRLVYKHLIAKAMDPDDSIGMISAIAREL